MIDVVADHLLGQAEHHLQDVLPGEAGVEEGLHLRILHLTALADQKNDEELREVFDYAVDQGVQFFDTAEVYGFGRSEELIGKFARQNPKAEGIEVATKFAALPWRTKPSDVVEAAKRSTERLGRPIDLYQIHGFDPATPIEETVRALNTLVEHGHVRYIGVSNWAAWQIMKALGIAERHGLARFESLQAYYTLAGRDLEREIVPLLQSENLGLMVWSPLAGGLLSGKYGRDKQAEAGSRRTTFDFPPVDVERAYDCIEVMQRIAGAKGVSVAQIALAWLLHQRAVTSVIVGAKRIDQLDDNIAAAEVGLSDEELAELHDVSALPPEYPGWMFERQGEYRRQQIAQSHQR